MLAAMKLYMKSLIIVIFFSSSFSISVVLCKTLHSTIATAQILRDNDTVVSSNGNFELGFFSPGSSTNQYLGIWYKNIQPRETVVWVANREAPIVDSLGVLMLDSSGNLVLLNSSNATVWSSGAASMSPNYPIAQVLDSGNLVVRDANDERPENFVWQSFDHPTDTLLPGMKLGKNLVTGHEWFLSSWRSEDDPAPGDYTFHCDPTGYPQLILRRGSIVQYVSGPWNGFRFSGTPNSQTNRVYGYQLVYNNEEMYYIYEQVGSTVTRYVMNQTGTAQRWRWTGQYWDLFLTRPTDNCDSYAKCGSYGICDISNSSPCNCLDKFVTKVGSNSSSGCVRRTPLNCSRGDGFLKYSNLKLPDSRNSWFDNTMSLKQCREKCLRNCTCMAYTRLNISAGGSGCLLWFDDLFDMRVYSEAGQDIYIRMASSELGGGGSKTANRVKMTVVLALSMLLLLACLFLVMNARKKKTSQPKDGALPVHSAENQRKEIELPLFDFATIANATGYFSIHNKLGEGGFGPVYKGKLADGQEIAVKRLSKYSNQGLNEFKNEVIYITKLQHRNLVKLLGCCTHGNEKMLIYEYMPNNSLESFIFDRTRSKLLDWAMRFDIINGTARGLLYLHQDSRLRIIHRDLKPSNILLDNNMKPKISDFGVARSFGENENQASTKRVVGTHGYMSPEYAVDGIFSEKSDVFSYGVLVLEIMSGKRNRGFSHPNHGNNLLGHAWRLFNEGRSLELVDGDIESCYLSQALRSIHIGLLCVQKGMEDRPSMSSIVLMLANEGSLVLPKQPGFFNERTPLEVDYLASKHGTSSTNEITTTLLQGK